MPYVMVDVESDDPIPGDYSMICFGAVVVESALNRSFCSRSLAVRQYKDCHPRAREDPGLQSALRHDVSITAPETLGPRVREGDN